MSGGRENVGMHNNTCSFKNKATFISSKTYYSLKNSAYF